MFTETVQLCVGGRQKFAKETSGHVREREREREVLRKLAEENTDSKSPLFMCESLNMHYFTVHRTLIWIKMILGLMSE